MNKTDKKKDKDVIRAPRIIPKEETVKKEKVKKKKNKDIEYERFDPAVKVGLSAEQVQQRIAEGNVNVVHSKNTKTYRSIIFGNIFTFFNLLCFLVAGALLAVGAAIIQCFFLIIVLANVSVVHSLKPYTHLLYKNQMTHQKIVSLNMFFQYAYDHK